MKKINYHTHTSLCRHAGGTVAEYVRAAKEHKLDVLGFSEHAPFPDGRFGLRMLYEELPGYLEDIHRERTEFKKPDSAKPLQLFAGLEIEYCPDMHNYYESLLYSGKIDYLLLGQHFYTPCAGQPVNIYFIEQQGDTSLYQDYASSVSQALNTGYFRLLAHPDVIFINNLPWDYHCEKSCDIIIEAALKNHTVVELNANGIRRGLKQYSEGARYPYPHSGFFHRAASAKLPVIIGSDCHSPDVLWDACMEEAYLLAEKWKLNLVDSVGL